MLTKKVCVEGLTWDHSETFQVPRQFSLKHSRFWVGLSRSLHNRGSKTVPLLITQSNGRFCNAEEFKGNDDDSFLERHYLIAIQEFHFNVKVDDFLLNMDMINIEIYIRNERISLNIYIKEKQRNPQKVWHRREKHFRDRKCYIAQILDLLLYTRINFWRLLDIYFYFLQMFTFFRKSLRKEVETSANYNKLHFVVAEWMDQMNQFRWETVHQLSWEDFMQLTAVTYRLNEYVMIKVDRQQFTSWFGSVASPPPSHFWNAARKRRRRNSFFFHDCCVCVCAEPHFFPVMVIWSVIKWWLIRNVGQTFRNFALNNYVNYKRNFRFAQLLLIKGDHTNRCSTWSTAIGGKVSMIRPATWGMLPGHISVR